MLFLNEGLIDAVSPMDRPKGQAWHTGLPFRSRQIRFEENDRILFCNIEIQSKRAVTFAHATFVRIVRKPHALYYASVFIRAWPTQS